MPIETCLKPPLNINFSQRGIFGMSLLYYANIVKYVDLFEDEECIKVVPLCIE